MFAFFQSDFDGVVLKVPRQKERWRKGNFAMYLEVCFLANRNDLETRFEIAELIAERQVDAKGEGQVRVKGRHKFSR